MDDEGTLITLMCITISPVEQMEIIKKKNKHSLISSPPIINTEIKSKFILKQTNIIVIIGQFKGI